MNSDNQTESTEIVEQPSMAMETMIRAEIDTAIATARRFPRSIAQFRSKAMAMATVDPDVAMSCFYRLQRRGGDGDKAIEGPSIRFAEIVAASYGNLRFGARIIDEGKEFVTAQGVAHDLENNVSTTTEVKRRITDKHGRRYKADMIGVTCNAACSIALRNAIFKAVPFSLAKAIYEQAKKVAVGDAKTLTERRTKMLAAFQAMGITPARVFASIGVTGLDDIGLVHLEDLMGKHTAIKDGDTTADEAFPDPKAETEKGSGRLADTFGHKAETAKANEPAITKESVLALCRSRDGEEVDRLLQSFSLHNVGEATAEQLKELHAALSAMPAVG